jgi:WhiB family redox-sensing transcriptional regulator
MTTLPTAVPTWMAQGRCRETDPELFFPEAGVPQAEALRICHSCEVRTQCLNFALAHGERGVWGGTNDAQRRRILRDEQATPVTVMDPVKAQRDAAVHRLTAEGCSAAEIAKRLGCTPRTVTRARTQEAA